MSRSERYFRRVALLFCRQYLPRDCVLRYSSLSAVCGCSEWYSHRYGDLFWHEDSLTRHTTLSMPSETFFSLMEPFPSSTGSFVTMA